MSQPTNRPTDKPTNTHEGSQKKEVFKNPRVSNPESVGSVDFSFLWIAIRFSKFAVSGRAGPVSTPGCSGDSRHKKYAK